MRRDAIKIPINRFLPQRNHVYNDPITDISSQYRHIYCYIITHSSGICKRSDEKIYTFSGRFFLSEIGAFRSSVNAKTPSVEGVWKAFFISGK